MMIESDHTVGFALNRGPPQGGRWISTDTAYCHDNIPFEIGSDNLIPSF